MMRVAGQWKEVATFIPPLSVSLSPAYSEATSINSRPVNSPVITATPTGGKAPYTYAWAVVLGPGNFTPNSPSTGAFTVSVPPGDGETTQVRCTVTSADGQTAQGFASFFVTGSGSGGGPIS